jgi:hypothetical protein
VTVQLSTEEFYRDFPSRAVPADVHGILVRVASPDDTLAGKMKAWGEPTRRQSKQAKDFTDIVRLVDPHSQLWQRLTPKLRPLVKTAGSLRRAFSRSSSFVTITAVPEPATLVLLALAWLASTESLRMNSKKHSPGAAGAHLSGVPDGAQAGRLHGDPLRAEDRVPRGALLRVIAGLPMPLARPYAGR